MNTIALNKNDFPLTVNVLEHLQSLSNLVQKITGLVGGNYVISGCVTAGSSVSAGYVCVNGEIMPFDGGAIQTYVRVNSTTQIVTVNDATYTKTTRYLVFGTGSGQIAWSTFRRATDLLGQIEGKANRCYPSGQQIDYSVSGLPAAVNNISLAGIGPFGKSLAIVELTHQWTYAAGTQNFTIVSNEGTCSYVKEAVYNTLKTETVVMPLDADGSFFITGPATYYAALKVLIRIIGVM